MPSDCVHYFFFIFSSIAIHPPSSCDLPCLKWPGWLNEVGNYAEASPQDADLWVFLTGSKSKYGLGLAYRGTVCNKARTRRVSINKYANGYSGPDLYTAEVMYIQ